MRGTVLVWWRKLHQTARWWTLNFSTSSAALNMDTCMAACSLWSMPTITVKSGLLCKGISQSTYVSICSGCSKESVSLLGDLREDFLENRMDREWNDSQPIYRQLRDRVVAMILDGVLKEGDPLPSVRN